MKTPDEDVCERIIKKFRDSNLLTEKGISKIILGLHTGKVSAEDWKVVFESDRPEMEE
jgi:hypothetical protein